MAGEIDAGPTTLSDGPPTPSMATGTVRMVANEIELQKVPYNAGMLLEWVFISSQV
jgi:hypothetical protein